MRTKLAPIALFAYKRPEHLRATLESLAANPEAARSELFVFCDGPKREADRPLTEAVRAVAREKPWCGKVQVIAQPENRGLRRSVVEGVSRLCEKFGEVIVLEDDLLLSPHLLAFMNEALERYRNEEAVMQVTAYNYPIRWEGPADSFFLLHSSCWGWGTWQRAWKKFDPQPTLLPRLRESAELRREFDMDNAYPYTELLELQAGGQVDSWGILWYQTLFVQKGLTLLPKHTLVRNAGMDGSGTHGTAAGYADSLSAFQPQIFPPRVESDPAAYAAISRYLKRERGWRKKAARKIAAFGERLGKFLGKKAVSTG